MMFAISIFSDSEKTKLYNRLNGVENALQAFTGIRRNDFLYTPEGDRAYLKALADVGVVQLEKIKDINNQFNHVLPQEFEERSKGARSYTDTQISKFKEELNREEVEPVNIERPVHTSIRRSLWSRIMKK